jgi:GT2 family glycosyltransferase
LLAKLFANSEYSSSSGITQGASTLRLSKMRAARATAIAMPKAIGAATAGLAKSARARPFQSGLRRTDRSAPGRPSATKPFYEGSRAPPGGTSSSVPPMDGRVAVIVVNFNGETVVERCLDAVATQTLKPSRVIVVDNASSDGSAQTIKSRYPEIELIELERNLGFAAANNHAAQLAVDCDWLALLNADAFPEPGWLEALVCAARENPDYSFFASRILRAESEDELDGTGDVYHVGGMAWRRDNGRSATGVRLEPGEVFSACAAAALYPRDLFLTAGGFDERFFCYYEDTDLAFRLRLRGHRCLYEPSAVVHHVGFALAGAESEFTVYHSQRNIVWTYVKNMPGPLLWLYLPQHLLVNVLNVGWYALRGRTGAVLRSKLDALRGLPPIVRARRGIQRERTAGSRELRRQMARGRGAYTTGARRALESWRGVSKPLEQVR